MKIMTKDGFRYGVHTEDQYKAFLNAGWSEEKPKPKDPEMPEEKTVRVNAAKQTVAKSPAPRKQGRTKKEQ